MMNLTSRLSRPAPQRLGVAGFFGYLLALDATWRQRKHLSELDARGRRDIGLTRSEIAQELSRPVWNAPHHWTR